MIPHRVIGMVQDAIIPTKHLSKTELFLINANVRRKFYYFAFYQVEKFVPKVMDGITNSGEVSKSVLVHSWGVDGIADFFFFILVWLDIFDKSLKNNAYTLQQTQHFFVLYLTSFK